jgi:Amt family ammonium transporter
MLWVGWFGFNAGSAVSAGASAGMAMLVTQVATAMAALGWMVAEWMTRGKPSVLGIISGAVAGLVAITPASGFVSPGSALIIGLVASLVAFWASTSLKNAIGYDDSLDVFGVHGVAGIVGAILTGVFAIGAIGGPLDPTDAAAGMKAGLIDGNPKQVLTQIYGVVVTVIYTAIVTAIIFKVVDLIIGCRVEQEVERDGLDLHLHGETIH